MWTLIIQNGAQNEKSLILKRYLGFSHGYAAYPIEALQQISTKQIVTMFSGSVGQAAAPVAASTDVPAEGFLIFLVHTIDILFFQYIFHFELVAVSL